MTDETALRVYRLACEGQAAARIAELLGLTRQTVSEHIQRLVKDHWLRFFIVTSKT